MGGLMNGWLTLPTFEILNQDSAIRQFCPARVEQGQGGEWGDSLSVDEDVEIWPHLIDETPQLAPSEVEEIVRTFFDVECYEKDNAGKCLEEEGNDLFDKVQEDGLQDLSMVDDDLCCGLNAAMLIEEGCDEMERCSSTNNLGSFVPNNAEDMIPVGVDQGLQLVHLLLACAEAVGCRDTQLADSILTQIWPCVNTWGDSLQRVSHCFAMGLKSRLSLLQNVNSNGFFTGKAIDVSLITREEKIEAFTLLHQTTPYISFGLMAANDAISQAATGKDFLHIIDLGMEHNLQWPCLVRTLASRTDGPPKTIRITGITGDHDTSELENSMKGLSEEAISLGISLEFQFLAEQVSPLTLTYELAFLVWAEADITRSRLAISVKEGLTAGFGAQHCSINLLHSASQ